MRLALLALILAPSLALACEGVVIPSDADSGRIVCDDGRTLRWRLPDVDAPETGSRARCAAERAAGAAAAREARRLAQGERGRLVGIEAADRYGRAVADVEMLGGALAGARLTDALTARGLLRPWPHDGGRATALRPDWCGRG